MYQRGSGTFASIIHTAQIMQLIAGGSNKGTGYEYCDSDFNDLVWHHQLTQPNNLL